MGYAIIRSGGKQFHVMQGQTIHVPALAQDVGASIEFDVLVQGDGDRIEIGAPTLNGVRVKGTVVGSGRDRKIIVFKKKRRKQYKKTQGHRQSFTVVHIDSIGGSAEGPSEVTLEGEGAGS